MNKTFPSTRRRGNARPSSHRWQAAAATFLATMVAWPAAANFPMPDEPLTAGTRIPANLLFILDNSNSMTSNPGTSMENPDLPQVCRRSANGNCQDNDISTQTYVSNTIYFNPANAYRPWQTAVAGARLADANYSSASSDPSLVTGSTTNLGNTIQTFYVPKDPNNTNPAYLRDTTNYYRYQILNTANGNKVVRSELLNAPPAGVFVEQNETNVALPTYSSLRTNNTNRWARAGSDGTSTATQVPNDHRFTYTLPTTGGWTYTSFTVRLEGTGNGDLYVRRNSSPATNQGANTATQCASANTNTSNEVCTFDNPQSGNWYVGVRGVTRLTSTNNVRLTATYSRTRTVNVDGDLGCDTSSSGWRWRNCTEITDGAAEIRQNYANWYAYHRTRMKAAKAAASEAFSRLDGSNVRVGFRTINPSGAANADFNIPVNSNGGLFLDYGASQNRTNWYNRLHGATAGTGGTIFYTPLRTALNSAGQYFSTDEPYQSNTVTPLSCRQNFTILTTDGYWNQAFNRPADMQANSDGTNGPNGYVAEAPYRDDYENTLADIAMHYWKTDLRPGLANNVPTTAANPANWQHMVTFGISIGLRGTINPEGPYPGQPGGPASWPDPQTGNSGVLDIAPRIDDLLHAAVNSRGRFIAASNPTEFANGLEAALAAIEERTGSFSNVAANSTSLDAGTRVFQANFVSGVWTGELRSQPVTLAGGVAAVDCSSATPPAVGWCASKGIPTTGRKVYTSDGHFSDDGEGTTQYQAATPGQAPRAFPTNATSEQLASLTRDGVTGTQNAAYIAGDRSLEQTNPDGFLRNRNHLLGDIVGSSPAYVPGVNGAAGTVYIGANDGMLHAFDAATGAELFAYIPGLVNWDHLAMLSHPNYGHRFFVDGPIAVTSRQQTPSRNVLVGALGKGGKGLYALDVTNPAAFGEGNNVLWERRDTPLGNMGLVQGRPVLAKVRNGVTTTNAVVVANGVNSTSGRAALIVLDLDSGDVIREIAVGTAGVANGLSVPTGLLGPDGVTLDYVYAGDMLGNVWKFNLSDADPDAWTATRLFTATNSAGEAQPITGGITLAVHPRTNQRWIFFGTGRYMLHEDVGSTQVQSMYGFIDDGTTIVRSGAGANLTQRSIEVTGQTINGYPVRGFQQRAPLPEDSKGWYIDLPDTGERIVQDAQVVSTFLVTASIIPSGDACEAGGRGYINALDAFTGTSAGGSYFNLDGDGNTQEETGVPPRPVGSVNVGGGMPTLPNLLRGRFVVGGSGGSDVRGTQTLAPRWDRASWREIRGD